MKAGIGIGASTVAAALAFAGFAVAAPGDTVLTGETDEAAKVKLTVGTAGNATKFKIGKTEVKCDEGGTLSNKPGTYKNFDRSDPGEFKDKRTTESTSAEFDFVTKSKLRGFAAEDGTTWGGTLRLNTTVFQGGEQIDTCKLNTNWTVG